MGTHFADQYSLLHFAVGIIAYFFNIPFRWWIVVHTLFELLENTPQGVKFISTHIKIWPGGKPKADTMLNSICDTVFAALEIVLGSRCTGHRCLFSHQLGSWRKLYQPNGPTRCLVVQGVRSLVYFHLEIQFL